MARRFEARELHQTAVAQFNAGHPARSLATLRRALTAVDGISDVRERRSLRARVWISIASSEAELFGVDRGLRALADAAVFVGAADDPAIEVAFRCQRGTVLLRAGKLREAVDVYDAAYSLIAHAEPHEQFILCLNRGSLNMYMGNLGAARSDLSMAVALARKSESETVSSSRCTTWPTRDSWPATSRGRCERWTRPFGSVTIFREVSPCSIALGCWSRPD